MLDQTINLQQTLNFNSTLENIQSEMLSKSFIAGINPPTHMDNDDSFGEKLQQSSSFDEEQESPKRK